MVFCVCVPGARLRSGVFVAGLSAAALGAFIFLYRWRRRDQQREPLITREIPHDAFSAEQDQELVPNPRASQDVSRLNGVFLEGWGQLILVTQQRSQDVQHVRRLTGHTLSDWFSSLDATKLVQVTLQHTSRSRGLQSEHWWVLTNTFYEVFAGLTPQQYVEAFAYIKRVGTEITVLKVYLRTESSVTAVFSNVMLTTTSRTFKGVSMRPDGSFDSSVERDTHVLRTPIPHQTPSRPAGPPPGF